MMLGHYTPTYREVLEAFVGWASQQEERPDKLVTEFLDLVGLT